LAPANPFALAFSGGQLDMPKRWRRTRVAEADDGEDKFRWILKSGWRGLCPRCGKGSMFRSWLKLEDKCPECALDYRFAAPDDGPAFFSLCIVAFPLMFVVVWLQVKFEPPFWVHLVTSFPLMILGCVLPLRPLKGWLVAAQYVNKAQEAGTEALWKKLHEGE
jgi:uncharacterized protein (DUF983 family)